jgi:hypothetical protein
MPEREVWLILDSVGCQPDAAPGLLFNIPLIRQFRSLRQTKRYFQDIPVYTYLYGDSLQIKDLSMT